MTIHSPSEKPFESRTEAETGQCIRERAYLVWQADGRQQGGEDEYWHGAQLIEAEFYSDYPPAQPGATGPSLPRE